MKQTSKKKTAKAPAAEIKYTRFAFWFPYLYGIVNAVFMFLSIGIRMNGGAVQNIELANFIQRAFLILCVFSPTAFILMLILNRKHAARYPDAPSFYKNGPGFFSIIVITCEVLFMVSMTL